MQLKSLILSRRSIFAYLKTLLRFKIKSLRKDKKSDKLFLNVPDNRLARYLFLNIHFLQELFSVYLSPNFQLLKKLTDYSEWLIGDKNTRLSKKNLIPENGEINFMGNTYNFKLNYDYFNCIKAQKDDVFIMPYFMHPGQYKWDYISKTNASPTSIRPLKIMFLGATRKEDYHKPLIKETFGLHTRYEIVEHLKTNFSYIEPSNDKEIHQYIAEKRQALIIYDTSKAVLWQQEWLDVLSKVDFYIALPGVSMPLCHNLIESMSVGAIPILEYGHFLFPKLEDKKNCLIFKSVEELSTIIRSLNQISQNEIISMRNEVLKYYNQFYTKKAFGIAFSKFLKSQQPFSTFELCINAEKISSDLYYKH